MRAIINTPKNIIEKGRMHVYHREDNKKANRIRRNIEKEKGKISNRNKNLCVEYAINILGNKKYAPWLMTYCAHVGEFKEGWIPDNYYGEVVIPKNQGEYGQICNRNSVINKLLNDYDTLDICYYVNNLFLTKDFKILNDNKLVDLLFDNNKIIVFKIENSLQGKGIYFFDKNSFDINIIRQIGNGVFQKYIEQHPFFKQFNDSAVATIRLTSTCDNYGNIDVNGGFFKFGRKGDTHVKSVSAIKIPVNINDGKLHENAFLPDLSIIKHLPDNDIEFAGMKLPSFDKCLAEIKNMHRNVPFLRCIGWDIIVDRNDNVAIIELNGVHNGIWFHEMIDGPCFKELNWESLHNRN